MKQIWVCLAILLGTVGCASTPAESPYAPLLPVAESARQLEEPKTPAKVSANTQIVAEGETTEPGVSLAAWNRIVESTCMTSPETCIDIIEKRYPGYFKVRMPISCQHSIDDGTSY